MPSRTDSLLRDITKQLHQLLEAARQEGRDEVVAQLRSRLNGKPARKTRRKATKKRRTGRRGAAAYDKLLPKLTALVKANGGTVKPGDVSEAFGLSPEQRRNLAARAVEAGWLRITGSRRSTVYRLKRGA